MSGSRDPDRWVVPGGGVEPTEDVGVAAVREVQEEAGVKGELGRCLGVFEVSTDTLLFVLGGLTGLQHAILPIARHTHTHTPLLLTEWNQSFCLFII